MTDAAPDEAGDEGEVRSVRTPIRIVYDYSAGNAATRFLAAVADGRVVGQRCPRCKKVYVPPRGACPTDGVPTVEEVELPGVGTITTFCVVNVPFLGQKIEIPYVAANILLDGADIPFQHLLQEVAAADVRMGMRVEAVWKPREEWGPTMENIAFFRPSGEPDSPYEHIKDHL